VSGRTRSRHDMRILVLNVLVGARERWDGMSLLDKHALVRHMRAIANTLETSIGDGRKP
jgi:hypothetical protein